MIGYLRFSLATLVLLSHLNVQFLHFNPGVFAVIVFYILAGWVLTRLWYDVLPQGTGRVGRLVLDRILRIYPLYFFVLILTIIFIGITGYGAPHYSGWKLLCNAAIIPLNYFMWFDSVILTDPQWCLIPPAWSLGAELQAYSALLLVFLKPSIKPLLAVVSLIIFFLADIGILHPDYFGYRLLPGIMYIFMLGHCLQRLNSGKAQPFDCCFLLTAWFFAVVLLLKQTHFSREYTPYIAETSFGVAIGLPLVAMIHRMQHRVPGNNLLGSLSYGLFLSHFLIIWGFDRIGFKSQPSEKLFLFYVVAVIGASLTIAWTGIRFVEVPINKWRLLKTGANETVKEVENLKKKIDFNSLDAISTKVWSWISWLTRH